MWLLSSLLPSSSLPPSSHFVRACWGASGGAPQETTASHSLSVAGIMEIARIGSWSGALASGRCTPLHMLLLTDSYLGILLVVKGISCNRQWLWNFMQRQLLQFSTMMMVFLPALYPHSLTPSTSSSSPSRALESCWWSSASPAIDNDSGILCSSNSCNSLSWWRWFCQHCTQSLSAWSFMWSWEMARRSRRRKRGRSAAAIPCSSSSVFTKLMFVLCSCNSRGS